MKVAFTSTVVRAVSAGLLSPVAPALVSCASNDKLEHRLDGRNDRYSSFQDRREMRQDARQDRTDAWFDRVMH